MADSAQPSGTPSTPEPAPAAPVAAAAPQAPSSPTAAAPAKAAEPAKTADGAPAPKESAKPNATPDEKSPEGKTSAEAKPADGKVSETKPEIPPEEVSAYTIPEDMKISERARGRFNTFLKERTKDGALSLKPQDVVDLYVAQAREAYENWQREVTAQSETWKAESRTRFSVAQLEAAETGVGFLSSFEPSFRELVKGIADHPSFVNAMREIGERLSEDSFEISGSRPPGGARRAAKDVLYPKRN